MSSIIKVYDVQVSYLLRPQNRAELSSGSSEDSQHHPVSQISNLFTFIQCLILVNVFDFDSYALELCAVCVCVVLQTVD